MSLTPRDPFTSPRFGQLATFMLLPAAGSAEEATALDALEVECSGWIF